MVQMPDTPELPMSLKKVFAMVEIPKKVIAMAELPEKGDRYG